ncbi:MAG TPA: Ig-like domain-containing protein [Thermoanaerobaculaceae bacterium]|nr:Ig-like domain-containing protein [Thermoanaerobaculaceae bacterium]
MRDSIAARALLCLVASQAVAGPPATPRTAVRPGVATQAPLAKLFSKLEVKDASGPPGETRSLEATLTSSEGASPLAGKKIHFCVAGESGTTVPDGTLNAGSGVTDAAGKVKVSFALPELPQGNYVVHASFAGDSGAVGCEGEGNLLLVKAKTRVELSELNWSGYKNEQGPPSGSFTIYVKRLTDNKGIRKSVTVKVNGETWKQLIDASGQSIPLPGKSPWNVHVQFEGDEAHIASAAQRTYVAPK